MELAKQIGTATVRARISTEDMGAEFPGECEWNLEVGQLRKILAQFPKMESDGSLTEWIGNAVENGDCEFSEMEDDDVISFRDADAGIKLLCAMGAIGGEWSIDWTGENAVWFFHDWDHATNDAEMSYGKAEIQVDGDREERAQANGAHAALLAGVDIADVCEALATIVEPFRDRFGWRPTDLFRRVFHGLKLVPDA